MALSSTSTSRVVLRLGSATAEVDTLSCDRRGALRVLAREVEARLGLYPQSYSLFGLGGEVDSLPALRRVLGEAAENGPCELEVRERPEWKWAKLREMDEQLQMLTAKGSAIQTAMLEQEERIMSKVQESLFKVREELAQTDAKVCHSLAPMVQCLSEEQMDLRSQIVEMKEELSQTDFKVCHSIAPMLQCLSEEQMDLRPQIAELQEELIRTDFKLCQGLVPLIQCLTEDQIDCKATCGTMDPKVRELELEQVDIKSQLDCLRTKLDVEASFSRLADITAECVAALGERAEQPQPPRHDSGMQGSVPRAVDLDCTAPSWPWKARQDEDQKWSPDTFTRIPFGSKAIVVPGSNKDATTYLGPRQSVAKEGFTSSGKDRLWTDTAPLAHRGLGLRFSQSTPHLLPPLQ